MYKELPNIYLSETKSKRMWKANKFISLREENVSKGAKIKAPFDVDIQRKGKGLLIIGIRNFIGNNQEGIIKGRSTLGLKETK